MKKLLLRAALLALPFLVLMVGFEIRFRRNHNNLYMVKSRLLTAVADKVEILTLGSSHGFNGLLPEQLGGKAFNLAAPGQTIYYDINLALKYAPQLPALKTVILPISDFSMETQLDQARERWRCYYYYMFYSIPHRDRSMAGSIRNFSLYFLQSRYYPFSHNELIHDTRLDEFDAWGGLLETEADSAQPLSHQAFEESAHQAMPIRERSMLPENIPGNLALLEKLARYLQIHHIRLILLSIPVTPEFRSVLHPDSYARMQQSLTAFAAEHGLRYLNYMADGRFSPSDFRDSNHLNYYGAKKFSRIVVNEILAADPPR